MKFVIVVFYNVDSNITFRSQVSRDFRMARLDAMEIAFDLTENDECYLMDSDDPEILLGCCYRNIEEIMKFRRHCFYYGIRIREITD